MEYKIYSRDEVYFNSKQKIYPNGTKKIINCNDKIFKNSDFEEVRKVKNKISKPQNKTNSVREDSVKRAKESIIDITLCNEFTYFITWTIDPEKLDRYNPDIVKEKLINFLHNMQKRNNLKYLIIPEYHKDGAIHIHGLISGDNIKLTDSGNRLPNGKIIYHMPQWGYGFSTAISLYGEPMNVAKYITKYMSKSFKKIFGKFYYSGGKGLIRHPQIIYKNVDYDSIKEDEYRVPNTHLMFKYEERTNNNES